MVFDGFLGFPMRILHAWPDYSPDVFDRSHELCLEHGLASTIVCYVFVESVPPLPATNWLQHRSPQQNRNSITWSQRIRRHVTRPFEDFQYVSLLTRKIAEFSPDIVHIHFGTTGALLAQWGRIPNQPFMVSFYGADASQSLSNPALVRQYRSIFERAALIHVLCDEIADRMISIGCPLERIVIANLPAKVENIPYIGVLPDGPTRYLIPARFVEKKGHRILLPAFKRLLEQRPGIRLTCYGYGEPAWLNRYIRDHGITEAVDVVDNQLSGAFLVPFLDMLHRHDVVLAPSIKAANGDDEGGPALTLVMAQAAGKPVIASDFPGIERSVMNGVEGLIVPGGDSDALYAAMLSIDGDVDAWRRFGRAGRARVMREFTDASYWDFLHAAYRSMVKTQANGGRV